MKFVLSLFAIVLFAGSCTKEEVPMVTPEVDSTAGKFSITFPGSVYMVDSLEGRFLQRDGRLLVNTKYFSNNWVSPQGSWKSGDTVYVEVKAWGKKRYDSALQKPTIVYSGMTLRKSNLLINTDETYSSRDTGTRMEDFSYHSYIKGRF